MALALSVADSRFTRELAVMSRAVLQRQLARRPLMNPVARFGERFVHELPWLQETGLGFYHAWAFASIRQLAAGFELMALDLEWLGANGAPGCEGASDTFQQIATGAKTSILKAARGVEARRALDASESFRDTATAWGRGMDQLTNTLVHSWARSR